MCAKKHIPYTELNCKTYYSFLKGASSPDELVDQAVKLGYNALALTDDCGVYGIPKAYFRAKNYSDFRLISGCELPLELPHEQTTITLLPQTREAYGLMCRIITRSFQEKAKASLSLNDLISFSSEAAFGKIFCLVRAADAHSGTQNTAVAKVIPTLHALFKQNLYFSVCRHLNGMDEVAATRQIIARVLPQNAARIVATNAVLYHAQERHAVHDVLTCVRENAPLNYVGYRLNQNAEQFLKSPEQMAQLFHDLPDALTATQEIADACTFSPAELKYRYPSEWIPKPHDANSYLREQVYLGTKERYANQIPESVRAQIEHELALVQSLNYADYFLTIYDIVSFARGRNILCQGRGSAANSAICFCLGITAIDPVRMNLLFERFISAERNEPPDIDVDFEHERREEVIQYIYEKYGRHRAAMVSAVVTYQHRSALRDVAKAFALNVGTKSAKEVEKNFESLAAASPIPNAQEKILKIAEDIAGFPRHLSIHSGGFTLSADPITEIVPVEPARMDGRTIIQWDKYDLDYLGLLKVDVLALGMLSALRKNLDLVGRKLHQIPAEDPATYRMIQKADTVGTFQVESRAQMNMSGRLLPKTFYDLVVQVAIVRPGPIVGQMVHPYLKRRRGLEPVHYPHPKLREILGKTLGIPLFQEQLMKIAIDLGDFSAGQADQLRRAIGAWRASGSIQNVAEKLMTGLRAKNIPEDYALNILEHMKGFAHYGFPESHAASFALLTYASCYLKCHYPAEFACSLINSQPMGFYSVHTILDDAKRHGVRILPVSPQFSVWDSVMESGAIRLGYHVVHGISREEAESVMGSKPFSGLDDFLRRTQLRRDTLRTLSLGNFFDCFGQDQRHSLWEILRQKNEQFDLFMPVPTHEPQPQAKSRPIFKKLDLFQKVGADYQSYGLSTEAHPIEALRKTLEKSALSGMSADARNGMSAGASNTLPHHRISDVRKMKPNSRIETAGMLTVRQRPPTANGVCFVTIEDETGFLDLVLFQKQYERYKDTLSESPFLKVRGTIERDGHSISVIVQSLESLR